MNESNWKHLTVLMPYVPTILKNAPLFAFHIIYSSPIYPLSPSHWYTTHHTPTLLSALFYSIWCSGVRFITFLSTILTSRLLILVLPSIYYLVTTPSVITSALQHPNLPCLGCSSDGWLTLEAVAVPLVLSRHFFSPPKKS